MRGRVGAENRPADHDDEERDAGCDRGAAARQCVAQKQPIQREEQAVIGAPQYEIPAGAVPQPGGEEADPEIDVGARLTAAVAAKGYIEIVADPGGERDVPAPPEIRDRLGDIG